MKQQIPFDYFFQLLRWHSEKREATSFDPAARQYRSNLRRSHPLPVQWNPLWNSFNKLWKNHTEKVHTGSSLLCYFAEHEAHIHLHSSCVSFLHAEALLLWKC